MQGPEGRPPNVSPARKGREIDPEDDPSAVGAALNRSSGLPVSSACFSTDRGGDPRFVIAQLADLLCRIFFYLLKRELGTYHASGALIIVRYSKINNKRGLTSGETYPLSNFIVTNFRRLREKCRFFLENQH
jgi:hypothetical protein